MGGKFKTIAYVIFGTMTLQQSQAAGQFREAEIGPRLLYYQIYVGNSPIGKATLLVKPYKKAASDTFVCYWQAEGIFNQEAEVYFLKQADLRPLRSRFVTRRDNLQMKAEVNYTPQFALDKIVRQGRITETKSFKTALPAGTIDIGMLRYALTLLPLNVGKPIHLTVFDVRDGKVVSGKGWVSRIVTVEVPAGKFQCYRVELFTGLAQEIDFIENRPPHRLVRQIYPAVDIDIRLLKD